VHVIVYDVVDVGETDCVPDVAVLVVHGAVQRVALVDDQVSVELCPAMIDVGEAVSVAVGAGAAGGVGGAAGGTAAGGGAAAPAISDAARHEL
jgi:hypothetical protein